jgi:hypothetical protein
MNLAACGGTFFDRINKSSLKRFAPAGKTDRIKKYESRINPVNPV